MNRTVLVAVVVAALAAAGVGFVAFEHMVSTGLDRSPEAGFEQGAPVAPPVDEGDPAPSPGRTEGVTAGRGTPAVDSADARSGAVEMRPGAGESAAIATLRRVAAAQARFQAAGLVDRDGNGAGEYGFFAELATAEEIATTRGGAFRAIPPARNLELGEVEDGRLRIGGYVYQMFLPGRDGGFVTEGSNGGAVPDSPSAKHAEVLWCCYAWPTRRGQSFERAFFVNQAGDVLASPNTVTRYDGTEHPPRPFAAFLPGEKDMGGRVAANATGADGERWQVVH